MTEIELARPAGAQSPPEDTRNPFASSRFTHWWLASMVAGTGVGIQAVTVPLFIRDRVELDVRALAIAAALIAQTLPAALLALVGGALADRVERRRILARTYSVAALVSVVYVVLSGFDVQTVWPVFPLAAIVGSAGAFTNPARQSLLPQLISRTQLQNGVIFGTMGFMATYQFVGPSLAGLVVDFQGLSVAFALEVALLGMAAVLFSRLHVEHTAHSGSTVLADLAAGVRWAAKEPTIRGLLLLSTVPGVFFIGPFAVTVPLLVPDILHQSDRWVGIFWGCFGAGVVVGSIVLSLRPVPRRGLAICLSTSTGGAILVLYGLYETLWLSAALLFAWGLSASIFINYVVALLQEHTEPRMMGRVMSMYSLVFFIAMPIGYAQAGLVTRFFGIHATLVTSGVISLTIGLLSLLLLASVRRLD